MSRPFVSALTCVCALVWSFIAVDAAAQLASPAGVGTDLTFEEAARKTLESHPAWSRFALEQRAAQARVDQAALKPAIELGVAVDDVLGTGAYQAVDGAEFTVSLASLFERGGKRAARVDVETRSLALLSDVQRVEALDLLATTGRRFVETGVAQERLRLAAVALDQANATVALIAPRVAAARSSKMELLNAQVQQTQARLAKSAAERELAATQSALATQWNHPEERPTVVMRFLEVPEPADFGTFESRLATVPDLARFASEAAVRDAEARLAQAQASTDWRWSVGVRRFQADADQALVVGLNLPLGATRRAAPALREAQTNRAIVDKAAEVTRLALRPLLYQQWSLLQTLRERVIAIGVEDLPRAREALEITERGYRIGRFPYRELALAQAQLIDLQLRRLDAAAQYYLTRLEIDRLTGAQVSLLPEMHP